MPREKLPTVEVLPTLAVKVLPTLEDITEEKLKGKTAVVVDVLRASSTIVTALARGCTEIIAVNSVEKAQKLAWELGKQAAKYNDRQASKASCRVVLGGERGGAKIKNFTLGNSPLEYTWQAVAQKILILTTTNGTAAICRAAKYASTLMVGSLLNARAVARAALQPGQDVVVVCAGTANRFCLEDAIGAGTIIKEMLRLKKLHLACDWAKTVYQLALSYKENPARGVFDAYNAQQLVWKGKSEDVKWCAELNKFDIVPIYKDGKITVI